MINYNIVISHYKDSTKKETAVSLVYLLREKAKDNLSLPPEFHMIIYMPVYTIVILSTFVIFAAVLSIISNSILTAVRKIRHPWISIIYCPTEDFQGYLAVD